MSLAKNHREKIYTEGKSKKIVYYNVSIPHNDLISVGGSPTPAVFSEVRDEPIFNGSPKDWNMSVVRFTVPTSYIPIQFFPVQEDLDNPANPNKSVYSVTLSYLGVDYRVFLQWETQNNKVPIPPPPLGISGTDFQSNPQYQEYYSLYSVNHFCDLINKALNTAFQDNIVPLLPVIHPSGHTSPKIVFDSATQLFSLRVSSYFLDTTPNAINIYFNTYLNSNFDTSFDGILEAFDDVDGKDFRLVLLDRGKVDADFFSANLDAILFIQTQEYPTIGTLLSFTSIIIRSVSLPVNQEVISLQPRYNNRKGSGIGSGSESIISDFEIDLGNGRDLASFVHYVPTAEYRRITMRGDTPITRLDLEFLWKDNYDNLYPILIPAHRIATVKIVFEEN